MATTTLASLEGLRSELAKSKYYLNVRSGYMAPVTLHCSYGDSGHEITFYIFDGGDKYTLDGCSVTIHGTRKDGANFGPFNCTVSGNMVTFTLQSAMTAVEGSAIAEFSIVNGGTTVGTCNFGILVENAVFPNGVSYDSDPSVYQDILKYVQTEDSNIKSDYVDRINQEAVLRAQADTTNADAISSQAARIDAIVDAGTTVEDGELIDIRTGYDGTSYASAGTAVRGQVTDIHNVLDELTYGYIPLKYSLASGSSVGTNWNNEYEVSIAAGSKIKIRFYPYSGSNFTRLVIFAYKTASTYDTLATISTNEQTDIELEAANSYIKLYFQLVRSAAEAPVSYSVFLKIDSGYALGHDIVGVQDSLDGIEYDTSYLKTNLDQMVNVYFNLFDLSEITDGYVYGANSKNIVESSGQSIATPIRVFANTTYYAKNVRTYFSTIFYNDGTKQRFSTDDSIRSTTITATKDGYAYISFNIADKGTQIFTTSSTLYSSGENTTYYTPKKLQIPGVSDHKVYYVKKDGTGDFASLVAAIEEATEYMDSTIYLGPGTWNIIEELGSTYISSVGSSQRGPVLKNRIHIIGSSNAIVTCNYTGTRSDTITWLSPFNAGANGFTLENIKIQSSNCRYSVHDERDTSTDKYTNKYINCTMIHNNSAGGYAQCIGGGLGYDGHIVIDGCIFENPNVSNRDIVSYHNTWYNGGDGRSTVEVKGCYFKGTNTFRASWYGASTDVTTFMVHDNSLGSAVIHVAETSTSENLNTELFAWNNEVRS